MKKIRLLLLEKCNRKCIGCCNQDWDLKSLPSITNFKGYDEILITGGEPMLEPKLVINTAKWITHDSPLSKIYLYTAKTDDWKALLAVLNYLHGVTVTLHDQTDVLPFNIFDSILPINDMGKSFRLNVFKDVKINKDIKSFWKIKDKIVWIKNSPLPKNEIFRRI